MPTQKTKKLVLVVEDDSSIAELIQIVLQKHGYKVKICGQGLKVEEMVRTYQPTIILMDLWIPGIDGVKLTKKLKSKTRTKTIPIILISAQNYLSKVVRSVKADGFLPKPFDLDELVKIVNKYCKPA